MVLDCKLKPKSYNRYFLALMDQQNFLKVSLIIKTDTMLKKGCVHNFAYYFLSKIEQTLQDKIRNLYPTEMEIFESLTKTIFGYKTPKLITLSLSKGPLCKLPRLLVFQKVINGFCRRCMLFSNALLT